MNSNSDFVRRLAVECGVPHNFVALVLDSCPLDLPAEKYKEFVLFVNDVILCDGRPLNEEMEFYAQSLAMAKDVSINLARIAIQAELMTPIRDDAVREAMREERIELLLKVFATITNMWIECTNLRA